MESYGKKPTREINSIGPENDGTVILNTGTQEVTFECPAANVDLSTYMITGRIEYFEPDGGKTAANFVRFITQHTPITEVRYTVGGNLIEAISDVQELNRTVAPDVYDNMDLSACSFYFERPGEKNGAWERIPATDYIKENVDETGYAVDSVGTVLAAPSAVVGYLSQQPSTIEFPSRDIGCSTYKNLCTGAIGGGETTITPYILANSNLYPCDYQLSRDDCGEMTDRHHSLAGDAGALYINFSIPLKLLLPYSVFSISEWVPIPQEELVITLNAATTMFSCDNTAEAALIQYNYENLKLVFTSTYDNIPEQHNIIVPRMVSSLTNSTSYTIELQRRYLYLNKLYLAFYNDDVGSKIQVAKGIENRMYAGLIDPVGNANVENLTVKLNTNILQNASITDKEVYELMKDNAKFKDFEYFLRKSNSIWFDFEGDNQVGIPTNELVANPQIEFTGYKSTQTRPNNIPVFTPGANGTTLLHCVTVYSGILSVDATKEMWEID